MKVGSALVMLSSAHEHSSLTIQRVMNIKCEFDIDEDDDFCTCSVLQLFLNAPYADSMIQNIEWFRDPSGDGDTLVLKAMGCSLERDEYLFFDPLNYFGLRIGGTDLRNTWLTQNPGVRIEISAITSLSQGQILQGCNRT